MIVEGGFACGTDVVKALAMGADLVGLGRLPCFGLAVAGQASLERVLGILEDEVRICLDLLGVTGWAGLDRSYPHAAALVTPPYATSAFPLPGEGY